MKLRRILVPVDGSVAAETIVDRAVDIARETGAVLVLVRATRTPDTTPGAAACEAEEYLSGLRARLADRGFTDVVTAVWYGRAGSAIAEAARHERADLIVMMAYCGDGIDRSIAGSVAESLVRETDTPVLLLRAVTVPSVVMPREEAEPAGAPR